LKQQQEHASMDSPQSWQEDERDLAVGEAAETARRLNQSAAQSPMEGIVAEVGLGRLDVDLFRASQS
jgi:hypothetical protein